MAEWYAVLAEGGDHFTSAQLGAAVAIAVFLIPAGKALKDWNKRERVIDRPVAAPTPQPLIVAQQPVFVTKDDVAVVDSKLRHDLTKLDEYVHESIHSQAKEIQGVVTLIKDSDESHRDAIGEVNRQGEERITKVHDRLNDVVREIGSLTSDSKHTTQRLVAMQQTLEVLLSRTAPTVRRGGGQG